MLRATQLLTLLRDRSPVYARLGRRMLWRWSLTDHYRRDIVIIASAALVLVLFATVVGQRRCTIVPVGKELAEAYQLLKQSPTGRGIVACAEKAAGGGIIYITMGETESDRLSDPQGREVTGLTRASFALGASDCNVVRATIIANKDLTGGDQPALVRNMAFELANIVHIYQCPCEIDGQDSPLAAAVQEQVAEELGL